MADICPNCDLHVVERQAERERIAEAVRQEFAAIPGLLDLDPDIEHFKAGRYGEKFAARVLRGDFARPGKGGIRMSGNASVRIGGVMRCCLDQDWPDEAKEGDVLECKHCDGGLRFRDGAWEAKWIGDKEAVPGKGEDGR